MNYELWVMSDDWWVMSLLRSEFFIVYYQLSIIPTLSLPSSYFWLPASGLRPPGEKEIRRSDLHHPSGVTHKLLRSLSTHSRQDQKSAQTPLATTNQQQKRPSPQIQPSSPSIKPKSASTVKSMDGPCRDWRFASERIIICSLLPYVNLYQLFAFRCGLCR